MYVLRILQKIIWIGPMKFRFSNPCSNGASILAEMLCKLGRSGCNITVVGNMACKAMRNQSSGLSSFNMLENASVVWEFFKGRKLPAVVALDRVCIIDNSEGLCIKSGFVPGVIIEFSSLWNNFGKLLIT